MFDVFVQAYKVVKFSELEVFICILFGFPNHTSQYEI